MSLYHDLIKAGIPTDNHESDLYAKVTPESMKLVRRAADKGDVSGVTTFKSNTDGTPWYDIPFAYVPYWEAKTTG